MGYIVVIIAIIVLLTACVSNSTTGAVAAKSTAQKVATDGIKYHVTIDIGETDRTIEVTASVFNSLVVGTAYTFRSDDLGSGYRIFDSAEVVE